MNRVVLVLSICVVTALGLLLLANQTKNTPVPETQTVKPAVQEPPTVDQIRSDLSGKTIDINGKTHQFAGPELNYMSILTVNPKEGGLVIDVQIRSDAVTVNKKGLFRRTFTHENVYGSLRVYYEKKQGVWTYRMAENIDLQKTTTVK